jgi:hypothetical protein
MSYKDPDYQTKYKADLKQHAIESIKSGKIIEQKKWDVWCKQIKIKVKNKKNPYSDEFTNDIIFNMMTKGCFYCGDVATSIDRIDSKLDHTPDNCVASCWGCNWSKGAADPSTFIRKAYYHTNGEYVDDITDIWFVIKNQPSMKDYKRNAEKKGVLFELNKEDWCSLIKGDCEYCKRTPSKWFGIDRVIPSLGYVIGNVVSCCYDCNLDKYECDVETTKKRNGRIADRVVAGELVIKECEKTILHKGANKRSKRVCAYGNIYESKTDASRALGKSDTYVSQCITNDWHAKDIFEVY